MVESGHGAPLVRPVHPGRGGRRRGRAARHPGRGAVGGQTPAELVGTVEELETLRCRVAALEASVLAEIAAQKIARTHLGWGSTGDWYTHLAGTHRTDGSRTVRQAGPLVDELPATHAALREGAVSPEQAAVIVDAIGKLPHNAGLRARGEAVLLEAAGRLNATDLAKAARHLLEVIDPDRTDRDAEKALDRADRAAHLGRYLSITEDGAGGVRLRGRGTLEDAATLKAALLPLTAPVPATDPVTCEDEQGPARPRRPALGRPDHHRRARPGHRPAPRLPRHPPPGLDHHQPRRPARPARRNRTHGHRARGRRRPGRGRRRPRPRRRPRRRRPGWGPDRLGHPGHLDRPHRGRPRTLPGHRAAPGLRRRPHPDRARHHRRGPRRRPPAPPGHPRPVARPGLPRPALRLPRLHPPPGHVPRPPHRALAPRRHHQAPQPGPALRPPPPPHPPHPLGSPHRRPTDTPSSSHPPNPDNHPAGSDTAPGASENPPHPPYSTAAPPTRAWRRLPVTPDAPVGHPTRCIRRQPWPSARDPRPPGPSQG